MQETWENLAERQGLLSIRVALTPLSMEKHSRIPWVPETSGSTKPYFPPIYRESLIYKLDTVRDQQQ